MSELVKTGERPRTAILSKNATRILKLTWSFWACRAQLRFRS